MLSYWRKRRSANKTFNVVLLDGSTLTLQLEGRCTGRDLVRRALEEQRILSNQEIFGVSTLTDNCRRWLNLSKTAKKQIPGHSPYTVHLCVWAYPRDHHSILQSVTRHQLYLQVRQDLLQGRLRLNENECGSLLGFVVQREVGDFDQQTCGDGYVQEMALLPAMSSSLEESVCRSHRAVRGRTERECEEEVLSKAQGEFTYGTHVYTVQDSLSKRSTLQLSICPAGVRVSESLSSVVTYEWEVIDRVAHKGKQLFIDLILNPKTPPPQGPTQFTCPSAQLAANLSYWCGVLRELYCHGNPPTTRSRLQRFFSSRRSMRRRPAVEAHKRLSGSAGERRSSFNNDTRYAMTTPQHTTQSPSLAHSDSKGLVVYGASGLASQDEAVTSYDITPIAEVVVHSELSEEPPSASHDQGHTENHISHDYSNTSHDYGNKSHDFSNKSHELSATVNTQDQSFSVRSHDLDRPEVKSLSGLVTHQTTSRDSPRKSHDQSEGSHDLSRWNGQNNVLPGSGYSGRSHDSPYRSHDSFKSPDSLHSSSHSSVKSHDSSRRSHDSPHRSYDSPHKSHHYSRRSHDSLPHSQHSPHKSHDHSRRSHDSLHQSHDSPHRSHDSPYHTHNGYKRYELGPQRKPSRESSPVTDGPYPRRRSSLEHPPSDRASSLTRHIVPDYPLAEDKEWVGGMGSEGVRSEGAGQDGQRYVNPAAKPKNRIRLSLPDTSYHDLQGRRGTRLSMSSRRARNTSIVSTTTTSLSQPLEVHPLQGLASKLGSIASLEAQASLAELSQSDSYMDPHMRSFVFQASQADTATEL